MSSASGEKASEEPCAREDDVAVTSCGNRDQSAISSLSTCARGDVQRPDLENGAEEEDEEEDGSGEGGGGGGGRASSSASSDSSVAVNCQSYPTEVVVHGRKVQKVRVLFTPFPPRMSTSSGHQSLQSVLPVRRRGIRRFRSAGSTVAQATDDGWTLPLSQEESSGCFAEGATSVGEQKIPVDHVMVEEGGDLRGTTEEATMRQEIQNGMTFIEQRLAGLIRINHRLRTDLDRETRNCGGLRERIALTETQLRKTETENDELKQRLDSSEKATTVLGEQAKEEWQRRIALEETLLELKRDKDLEVSSLKDQLESRNAEMRDLEVELRNRKQTNENENKNIREETVELMAQVSMLEETLVLLQREKDRVDEVTSRLEAELDAWKAQHASSCRDLELQMGRFQALKKSYADLQEENQRLAKSTQRILRDPHGTSGPQSLESIRIIDLPEQTKSGGGSLQGQHQGHTALTSGGSKMAAARESRIATQSRKKSQDSAGSDNSFSLPPVQKFNK